MRKLLLSTAALLLLAAPAFAQPNGNRGEDHSNRGGQERSNRVGKASVAPQVQDRAQAELRAQRQGGGTERRGEIRGNAPAPSQSTAMENRGGRDQQGRDRDRGERGAPPAQQATIQSPEPSNRGNWRGDRSNRDDRQGRENRGDNNRGADRRDWNNGRDFNRDGRTDYRRGAFGGPRRDFSSFRDYHRTFRAPRRFRAEYYRRPAGWYEHRWAYGEFLPSAFWARDYWIVDFAEYDLPPPPYGAIWVRVASDALLIDEDSGEVITVAYDVFY